MLLHTTNRLTLDWIWFLTINILKVFLLFIYDIDVQEITAAEKDIKACFSLSAHFTVAN